MSSAGAEAVELARMAGLVLDPWQEHVLEHSLAERTDGRWAAFEVGVVVGRQNGKNAILEARELAGLFLLGERLIVHSAHQFDTSLEAFRRLLFLIEDNPVFAQRVKRVSRSHGEEGIELKNGQRIRFRTRTKGGGRGFTADLLVFDEAMVLPEASHGALLPTLSARPNPQVWYTGSAVDQLVQDHGLVLARVRDRGIRGDESLAYFEWSVDAENPDAIPADTADDPEAWAWANPGLGIRISEEHVANERRSMDWRMFAVERLGVGDWPDLDPAARSPINMARWLGLTDPRSTLTGPVWFAYDVNPDRTWATIAVAGDRPDGLAHIEVIDRRKGTGWVLERIADLVSSHDTAGVVCDGVGPAGSLVPELAKRGVACRTVSAREHAEGCGMLVDAVEQSVLRHLGSQELGAAIRGATTRPLGDSWAWSRKSSSVDIAPLVACTLAHWAARAAQAGGGIIF